MTEAEEIAKERIRRSPLNPFIFRTYHGNDQDRNFNHLKREANLIHSRGDSGSKPHSFENEA